MLFFCCSSRSSSLLLFVRSACETGRAACMPFGGVLRFVRPEREGGRKDVVLRCAWEVRQRLTQVVLPGLTGCVSVSRRLAGLLCGCVRISLAGRGTLCAVVLCACASWIFFLSFSYSAKTAADMVLLLHSSSGKASKYLLMMKPEFGRPD